MCVCVYIDTAIYRYNNFNILNVYMHIYYCVILEKNPSDFFF